MGGAVLAPRATHRGWPASRPVCRCLWQKVNMSTELSRVGTTHLRSPWEKPVQRDPYPRECAKIVRARLTSSGEPGSTSLDGRASTLRSVLGKDETSVIVSHLSEPE